VGVLSHLAALIRVEEDIVDVERGGNKGLLVGSGDRLGVFGGRKALDRPEALTNGAEIDVDLHLVVLESNEGKSKTGVAAEPEKEGDVEGGLREGIARSANLGGSTGGGARTSDAGEAGVSDVGKLGGVTNHLEVSALLLGRHGDLIPDVHPITVLAIDALTTDLNLNLGDELLTDEIQPTSPHASGVGGGGHSLVDLRESNLEVCAVAKITVTGDRASYAATEISLTREGLLNGLHREVCVAAV